MSTFPGRLGIQQRVLAGYRAPFFDALALKCARGLSICSGLPLPEESIDITADLKTARTFPARNLHLLRGRFMLCHQRDLLRWLATWEPDVLIVEVNPRLLSTVAGLRWMNDHDRPVLGWGLGSPPAVAFPGWMNQPWDRFVKHNLRRYLRRFDGLLTYSRRGAREYEELGFSPERIFIAPNAATPVPAGLPPQRADHFDGRPCVLFIGRLQKRKQVDLLLHACAALPDALQPRLLIVGDGPELPALRLLAGKIYPRAEFPGAKRGAELAPFYEAADLFVLPGTGGLAVQEAMSHGLPVIMGAGDGTNDDLVRPGNGWQLHTAQDLPGLLRQALEDVPRLRAMGVESFRIVKEEINLDVMVSAFLDALQVVSGP